jgi:hypothetical protein
LKHLRINFIYNSSHNVSLAKGEAEVAPEKSLIFRGTRSERNFFGNLFSKKGENINEQK